MPHAHNVFFTLNDAAPAKCGSLVLDCYEYLKETAGAVAFSSGTRAVGCERDVNDVQWDVSLHMVFADRKTHDAYQTAPRHMEFVTRNKANWKKVRVFDTTVSTTGK